MVPISAEHQILWESPKRSLNYRRSRIRRSSRKNRDALPAHPIISSGRSTVTVPSSNISFGFVNTRWDFILKLAWERNPELITTQPFRVEISRESRYKMNREDFSLVSSLPRNETTWDPFLEFVRRSRYEFWWLPYMQGRNNWMKSNVLWRHYFISIFHHVTISILKSVVVYFNQSCDKMGEK